MTDDSFKDLLTNNLKATPEDSPYAGEVIWNHLQMSKRNSRRGLLWKVPLALATFAVAWMVFIDTGNISLSDEEKFLYTEWSEMMEEFSADQDTAFVVR